VRFRVSCFVRFRVSCFVITLPLRVLWTQLQPRPLIAVLVLLGGRKAKDSAADNSSGGRKDAGKEGG
jgi:hypothetical protein